MHAVFSSKRVEKLIAACATRPHKPEHLSRLLEEGETQEGLSGSDISFLLLFSHNSFELWKRKEIVETHKSCCTPIALQTAASNDEKRTVLTPTACPRAPKSNPLSDYISFFLTLSLGSQNNVFFFLPGPETATNCNSQE